MKNKDGAFMIIFRDSKRDEVFLICRSDQLIWNLPGGGIEDGERPEEAAVRETFEETGFTVKLSRKIGRYKNIDVKTGGIWNITYLFEGVIASGKFTPEFPGCKGGWFTISNLPPEIKPVTLVRIQDALTHSEKTPFIKEFKPSE